MPERLQRLRTAVDDLQRELSRLNQVDPDTRQALLEAVEEIEAALADDEPERLKPKSLSERLTESVESFEASHPTLASVVTRMADALGQLGI